MGCLHPCLGCGFDLVADLDGDQDLKIITGNESGNVYVLHHDGSSMNSFETDGEINGGVSVADIDGNGSMELLFNGSDGHLHAWDPIANEEAYGWPINIGSSGINEAITMDMDNDGDHEIMCVTGTNEIHLYHHDDTQYNNFPYISQYTIYSTPAIGDIDNDGDTDSADKYVHNKRQAITKALSKDEQAHIKKEFGIKYEALSPEKQKEMDKLMKDFLARGGKVQKLKPGIAKGAGHLDRRGAYKKDMLKGPKKHLAASKDNSDDLASKKKTATGQKVSSIDTKPNIKEV